MHESAVLTDVDQTLPVHHGKVRAPLKTLYLDGLRGLAAFLVYMQHQTGWFYGAGTDIDLGYGAKMADGRVNHQFASLMVIRLLYNGGSAAVAVFFVLSGYVLSRRSLQMIYDGQYDRCASSLRSAIVRRSFRLYLPVVAVTLIFGFWLHLPFGFAPKVYTPAKQSGLATEVAHCVEQLAIYLNPFQQHGWYVAWFPYNGTLWTIPIELKGSMLVFGVVAILNTPVGGQLQKYENAGLFIIASILLMINQWTMSLFVFGTQLSVLDVKRNHLQYSARSMPPRYPRLQAMARHFELLMALYLLSQPVKGQEVKYSSEAPGWALLTKLIPTAYLKDEYYRFYQSIGAVMLVHSVLHITWLQQLLTAKALMYLGRVSFSFYLIHIPVLWVYGDRAQRLLGVVGRNWNGPLWVDAKMAHLVPDLGPVGLSTRFIVAVWGILPIILGLSELGTRFIDEPSIQFSRWLSWQLGFESRAVTDPKGIASRKTSGIGQRSSMDRID